MNREIDTFVFDLDGTLLDTAPDLVALTDRIMDAMGKPRRSKDEVVRFVGGGLRKYLELALPDDASEDDVDEAERLWNVWYTGYYEATDPYEGIPELLEALKDRGCRYAIFSNRDKEGVDLLIEKSPLDGFEATLGTGAEIPRKPEPDGVVAAMEMLGARPERTLYIGDTPSDIVAGNEAGCMTAAVTWGYHTREELEAEGPDIVVAHPIELLGYAASGSRPC